MSASRSIRRRATLGGVLAGGFVLSASALLPALTAGAHATAGGVSCTGTQNNSYTPGLTNTPQQVDVKGASRLSSCKSLSDPTINSGISVLSSTGPLSCNSGTAVGTRTIQWNNGRSSTMSFRSTISANKLGASIVTLEGKVTQGEFLGSPWNGTFTLFPTRPLACMTAQGLTAASGPLVINILTS